MIPADSASDPGGPPAESPRVLIAATLRWPFAARLAMAFRDLGCTVDSWCPRGHPLDAVSGLARRHRAARLPWARSLRAALLAQPPELVVPCDDETARVLGLIHRQCARGADAGLRALIERSLGVPESCRRAAARGEVLALARAIGVPTPPSAAVDSLAALDRWCAASGLPAVLKSDGSWGGRGVTVLRTGHDLGPAWRDMRTPPWRSVLAELLLRRDSTPLRRRLLDPPPALTVQGYVPGRPANRAVACWQGEVLDGMSVEALETQGATGPACVVRRVEHPGMEESARRIVGALGLSGFCGLDFVLTAGGEAQLLEVNPRATPICHLFRRGERSLPAGLLGRMRRLPPRAARARSSGGMPHDVVAMFPGEWRRDPDSPWLVDAFHDVPWNEPALVRDGVRDPWAERGWLARLRAAIRPAGAPVAAGAARVAAAR